MYFYEIKTLNAPRCHLLQKRENQDKVDGQKGITRPRLRRYVRTSR